VNGRASDLADVLAARLPIELDGIGVERNGVALLRDVELVVAAGERTIVIGANGAGKSTLLRVLHGLLQPTSGTIRWGGKPERPNDQAMVFQRPMLLRCSVVRNLSYALKLAGASPSEQDARARRALHAAGLGDLARRPARRLSGGEQQRVALARAEALQPAVLLLDEPTASLDPAATRAIEARVCAAHESGTTIVMSTHNLAQARRLAQRVVFLQAGRLVEATPAEQFFRAPRSAEAAAFLDGERI
jgi:tungstate transport system ATP-binding protein